MTGPVSPVFTVVRHGIYECGNPQSEFLEPRETNGRSLVEIGEVDHQNLCKRNKKLTAFVTPHLDQEESQKRRLQIPALAGRLTWLLTR